MPSEKTEQPGLVLHPTAYTPTNGCVALFDALGARSYSQEEAAVFLGARDQIVSDVQKAAAKNPRIESDNFRVFVFNDTVVLAYLRKQVSPDDLIDFCGFVRAFQVAFLMNDILLRGAISMGLLYRADDKTNAVMGPAVSDAATWYERADWIGVLATPSATVKIRLWLQQLGVRKDPFEHVLLDYDVPLNDRRKLRLRSLNWPKGLHISFGHDRKRARTELLSRFAKRPMPDGTESKYLHAVEFFDHCDQTGLLLPKPKNSAKSRKRR